MNNRRNFLGNATKLFTGLLLVPGVFISNSTAADTRWNSLQTAHKADLRSSGILGKHIVVKGNIYDKAGVITQPGVTIEVQNSSSTLLQSKKGTMVTSDENGEFELLLDMPERKQGRAPRVKFHISNGINAYSSEVIVTKNDAQISDKHWERNHQLGDKLFPVKEDFSNHTVIFINLSI